MLHALPHPSPHRNRELAELFDSGFGIHHAGMLRGDRTLTERLFADGLIKVCLCADNNQVLSPYELLGCVNVCVCVMRSWGLADLLFIRHRA